VKALASDDVLDDDAGRAPTGSQGADVTEESDVEAVDALFSVAVPDR